MTGPNDADDTKPDVELRGLKIESQARALARVLRDALPPGLGFTLFLFEYGDGAADHTGDKALTYISSARRRDMLGVIRDFMARPENVRTVAELAGKPPEGFDLEDSLGPLDPKASNYEFRLTQRCMRELITTLARNGAESDPRVLITVASGLLAGVAAGMMDGATTAAVDNMCDVARRGTYMFLDNVYNIHVTPPEYVGDEVDTAMAEAEAGAGVSHG